MRAMVKSTHIKAVAAVLGLGLTYLAGYSYGVHKTILDPTLKKSSLLHQNNLFLKAIERIDQGETDRLRRNLLMIVQSNFDYLGELDRQREQAHWWDSYSVLSPTYSDLLQQIDNNVRVEEEALRKQYENFKTKNK